MSDNTALSHGICKIVYFDEGSATDYIQIVAGGQSATTTENMKELSAALDGSAGAAIHVGDDSSTGGGKQSIVSKIIGGLLGFNPSLDAQLKAGGTFDTSKVVKSIISNTVLTDFLNTVDKRGDIEVFDGYTMSPIDNSLSSYALMTPYLSMIKDGSIPAGEFSLALDKLDATINSAKGYFEFLGISGNSRKIFRFNNDSFKNNYKARDLMRMNLVIYAVKVGRCTFEDLDVNSELNLPETQRTTNPDYCPDDRPNRKEGKHPRRYFVYDVLLAGVRANG